MLTSPPREREWVSWLYVVAWTLGIFAAIPAARWIQGMVQEQLGREWFGYAVITVVLGAVIASGLAMLRRREHFSLAGVAWLSLVAAIFVGATIQLRAAPEESVHFVQYGGLGLLAYRAFTHRLQDSGIYVAAALLGIFVGTLDEAIQWLTPRRFWGLRDIGLNALAAGLVQVGIAKGLRPELIRGVPGRRSVRACTRLALAAWVVVAASALNTPARIEWYTEHVGWLAPLRHNPAVMLEYGHLHSDPRIGSFRSRLARSTLIRTDAERGREVAAILDRYPTADHYEAFLERYRPGNEPFLHEVRVHLFRRDRHLEKATEAEPGSGVWRHHLTVALGEQRILEMYFPNTLRHSGYRLDSVTRRRIEAGAIPGTRYQSGVSRALVTDVGEPTVLTVLALVLVSILALGRLVGRGTTP